MTGGWYEVWAFFSRRLRMWLLLALVAPAVGWLLGAIGQQLEARRGPTRISRGLRATGDFLLRRSLGPLRNRPPA